MGGAQIRRFLILHKELDADDGELTRTQKVRRGFIAERYAPLIAGALRRLAGGRHRDGGHLRGRPQGRDRGAGQDPRHGRPIPIDEAAPSWRRPNESARRADPRQGRRAPRGREHLAGLRRRQGADRCLLRHPEGRDPRHHRAERGRQDLDAELHQRLLPPDRRAASPSRAGRGRGCAPPRPRAAASPARSRTSRCSRACRRSTTSWPAARSRCMPASSGSSCATARR